uniref:Uncharacterized protein n=1 Tax=Geladintestivirus 1 TaxID=3233133 RepID=A0AAU8MLI9_9CAUD
MQYITIIHSYSITCSRRWINNRFICISFI